MLDELLHAGDEVIITISRYNREWGYNPFPDGMKAVVIGFAKTYSGTTSHAWPKLLLGNGREHTEFCGHLELINKAEYRRRYERWLKEPHKSRE